MSRFKVCFESTVTAALYCRTVKAVRIDSKQYLPDKDGLESRDHLHVTQGHVLHCKGPCTQKQRPSAYKYGLVESDHSLNLSSRGVRPLWDYVTPRSQITPRICHYAESDLL